MSPILKVFAESLIALEYMPSVCFNFKAIKNYYYFLSYLVHSNACSIWGLSIHGSGLSQWSAGKWHVFYLTLCHMIFFPVEPQACISPCIRCVLFLISVVFCSLWIVLSCFWCRRNISLTWFTCDTFPSGRSTSSPSSRFSAWLCCGSSSPPWLPSYSLSW